MYGGLRLEVYRHGTAPLDRRHFQQRIENVGEIIADLTTTVVSPEGQTYHVRLLGEQLPDRVWRAWLEFIPLDDGLTGLSTKTETRQPTRADVVRWSETLTAVYLQGAFARAVGTDEAKRVRVSPTIVTRSAASVDPFEVLRLGRAALRARLRVLSRSELLAIIERYNLNPAHKDLTGLSDSQLVTFIITAAEVQASPRKG